MTDNPSDSENAQQGAQQPRTRIRMMLKLHKKVPGQQASFTATSPGLAPINAQNNTSILMPAPMPNVPFCGVTNAGNSCYAAATLQVLFHCVGFRQHVMSTASMSPPQSILRALSVLFKSMQQQSEVKLLGKRAVSVTEFFHCLRYAGSSLAK